MRKLAYSALALTLTALPGLATDDGWSSLDREIERLSSSLSAADGSAPRIGGWIRTSYRRSSEEVYTGGVSAPDQSGFQFDWIRLEVQGNVDDDYGYRISFDLSDANRAGHGASPNGALSVRDAYATWRIADDVKGQLGRFKAPLLRSELTSRSLLIFLDRTAIGEALSTRDLGLAVSGSSDVLGFWASFQDGGDGQADEHKYTLRVTADITGTAAMMPAEGAYGAAEDTVVTVGAAYQDDTFLDEGTILAGEATLNMGRFSLAGEIAKFGDGTAGIFGRTVLLNDAANTTPWDVTVSCMIASDWELAGRFESTDDSEDTTSYSLAVDYYVQGHDIKWQAQWRKINTDNAVGDNDQFGVGLSVAF
jgi:hypothetical protein